MVTFIIKIIIQYSNMLHNLETKLMLQLFYEEPVWWVFLVFVCWLVFLFLSYLFVCLFMFRYNYMYNMRIIHLNLISIQHYLFYNWGGGARDLPASLADKILLNLRPPTCRLPPITLTSAFCIVCTPRPNPEVIYQRKPRRLNTVNVNSIVIEEFSYSQMDNPIYNRACRIEFEYVHKGDVLPQLAVLQALLQSL